MKFLKSVKIIDLIISILFIIMFFYKYQITASYEYGLGQLIELFFRFPVIFLLLVSVVMSSISMCNKKSIYLFSIISQCAKIAAYLLNFLISKFILQALFRVDYLILILIYSILMLITLIIYKTSKVHN